MHRRITGLWQHPEFLKLWLGQTVSLFGSQIGGGALRFTAILLLGASPLQLGLLTAARLIPILLTGLLVGAWVDRLRRRPILIVADAARALLLLSIPAAFAFDLLRIEQLYLVAALVGLLTVWFDVAYQAFLPSVVGRRELLEGNSKLGMSDSVAEIAGPPLGGALVQLLSAPLVILIDAVSFLVSALAIGSMRTREAPPEPMEEHRSVRHEITAGLATVQRSSTLRALLLAGGIFSLGGGIIGTLYDLYLLRTLGLSPAIVGVTIGVGGLGALAGAFLARPAVERWGIGPTVTTALAASGVAGLLLPAAHGPIAISLPLLLLAQSADVAIAVYFIGELSLRQSVTPDRLQGRVNASFGFVMTAASLLGTLLSGVLGETIGPRGAIAVGVLAGVCASLVLLRSPVRRIREAALAATDAHAPALV